MAPADAEVPGTVISRPGAVPYRWHWRKRLPERHGQPCRVLARGALNSVLVEFEDGYRVFTSRFAVRKSVSPPRRR